MDYPEDKKQFVDGINDLLIDCGNGYYDWLNKTPLIYLENDGYGAEVVCFDGGRDGAVNVTGCSLSYMLSAIYELL